MSARDAGPKITTLLTFSGAHYGMAEEAIRFYVSVFPDSKLEYLRRHGSGEGVPAGELQRAAFTLTGQRFMATESQGDDRLSFTPAFSLYVQCRTAEELTHLFDNLAPGGKIHLPLGAYPSTPLFAWFDDRYGVSWMLELPKTESR